MFSLKRKIAITVESLKAQADTFLKSSGFPTDEPHRKLFGSYIQCLHQNQDYFRYRDAKIFMRKTIANESAFFLMNPKKYEEYLKAVAEAKEKENERIKALDSGVEQKAP